ATINAHLAAKGLMLRQGTVVDATLIAAPSSTKNRTRSRDPEMVSGDESEPRTTKKGNPWYFGMKAHIGVDADSGLVHTVVGTAANVSDVTQASQLLHGQERDVFADAIYQGADKREDARDRVRDRPVKWHVAMRPGKRRALDTKSPMGAVLAELERIKASIRAKAEHPFHIVKNLFGYRKTRYRGLAKNTAQLMTLFALAHVWLARKWMLNNDTRSASAA
ncbi:MAG: IS5 family transposase, partial [Pseudomonadota bacterium]